MHGQPLLREGSNKKGCHGELNTFSGKGQYRAQKAADHTAAHPVALVEKGDQKPVAVCRPFNRHLPVAEQGVGLICQGKDHIGLVFAGIFIALDHGDAVEKVPGIDHKGRQCRGQHRGTAGQQADAHVLHGTGIDKGCHGKGPENAVTGIPKQDTEADAQDHIAGHDRQ